MRQRATCAGLAVTALVGLGLQAGDAQARMLRSPATAPAAVREKPFPFDVNWTLQTVNGIPAGTADPPSLSVDTSLRARGFAGCNGFSMPFYPVKNQTLASGAIALTRKSCAPAVMAAERAFLVALHSLPHWSVTADGDLVITAPHAVLRFRRGI